MTLGDRLRKLRTKAGLSPNDISQRAKLPVPLLYAYESGKTVPSIGTAQRLSKALGVRLSELVDSVTLPPDARSKART